MQLEKPGETLKFILEHLQDPGSLDNHPWVVSAFVKGYITRHPEARELSAGRQLGSAVVDLFEEWMPSNPPRQGKRLDNRWGEYGLLAAQYAVPYLSGTPSPRSFKEAWGGIDQAIGFLISRRLGGGSPEILRQYALVASEPEAANSTVSDWHRKGLERFAEFVSLREKHIESEAIKQTQSTQGSASKGPRLGRTFAVAGLFILAALAVTGIWAYFKAQRVIAIAQALRQELQTVQSIEFSPETLKDTTAIRQSLENVDANLRKLDEETRPYLWLTQFLGWVPTYGGDLENSESLLDMVLSINDSLQATYRGVSPLLEALDGTGGVNVNSLVEKIQQAEPDLKEARQAFERAKLERASLDIERLSPQVRELVIEKIDPGLSQLEQALGAALSLPNLLGASSDGPKTYMVIMQNEDELRATGGFLTAVGSLVVRDGKIVNMLIESSDEVDDLTKQYSSPPWQLEEYMDASIYLLRDANWSPDFPTTAAWVEYLYAYTRAHSVDGILAFNQYAIVKILETIGPVKVEDYPQPITAENVIETIRKSKIPPLGEKDPNWNRKDFLGSLARPMLEKIMSGQGFSWSALAKTLTELLDQKHILIQLDDENIASLLAEKGWDGRITPFDGDYLMVIDSNIGFSKTNAIIEQAVRLEIDLRDAQKPGKYIRIEYRNPAENEADCDEPAALFERYYPIERCYGDYLRIYVPEDSILTASTPHAVPGEWTARGEDVPARVDTITDDLEGFGVFGTYFVVPSGETLATSFRLQTPAGVIVPQAGNAFKYTLKIQKQPGVVALPFSIRLLLPEGATVLQAPKFLVMENGALASQINLREDALLEIIFSLPTGAP